MTQDKIDNFFQSEVDKWESERSNKRWVKYNTISLQFHTQSKMMSDSKELAEFITNPTKENLAEIRKEIFDYFKIRENGFIKVSEFELKLDNHLDKLYEKITELVETMDKNNHLDIFAQVYYHKPSTSYKFIFIVKEKSFFIFRLLQRIIYIAFSKWHPLKL